MIHFKRKDLRPNTNTWGLLAFVILVFFVILFSVTEQKGAATRPVLLPSEDETPLPTQLTGRNVLHLHLDKDNNLTVNGEAFPVDQVRGLAKEFVDNPNNDRDKPEKRERNIAFFGPMVITYQHLIVFTYDRATTYEAYVGVRNELLWAYAELRDELAQKKWQKNYINLTPNQQKAVRQIYPQQIEESLSN